MRIALLSLAAVLAAGCNPTVSFDTTVKGNAVIRGQPGLPLQLPPGLGFNNMSFSQSADFSNNNTDKSHVDHVRVKSATLTVTSPSPGDLSFLQSLAFNISAQNQQTVQIAHQTSFPKGQAQVAMAIDPQDLAPYAKADSFSIGSSGTGTAPTQDTSIDIVMVLTIDAHVL